MEVEKPRGDSEPLVLVQRGQGVDFTKVTPQPEEHGLHFPRTRRRGGGSSDPTPFDYPRRTGILQVASYRVLVQWLPLLVGDA